MPTNYVLWANLNEDGEGFHTSLSISIYWNRIFQQIWIFSRNIIQMNVACKDSPKWLPQRCLGVTPARPDRVRCTELVITAPEIVLWIFYAAALIFNRTRTELVPHNECSESQLSERKPKGRPWQWLLWRVGLRTGVRMGHCSPCLKRMSIGSLASSTILLWQWKSDCLWFIY